MADLEVIFLFKSANDSRNNACLVPFTQPVLSGGWSRSDNY